MNVSHYLIEQKMDKFSYAMGLGVGRQLAQMGAEGMSIEDFTDAINDVLGGKEIKMSHHEAQTIVQEFFIAQEKKMQAINAEKGKAAKEAGEKFLAENAKKEGVKTTASGLQYEVLKEGTGRKPKATDTVECHYEGFLLDGTLFDSSVQRGQTASFSLQQVIAGWTEGLQLMQEGAKFRFYIPYMLAYGESGAGASIPPFSTLIFDVELIGVK